MASNDPIQIAVDAFEQQVQTIGTSLTRVRKGYREKDGTFVPEDRIETKGIFVPIALNRPEENYSVGMLDQNKRQGAQVMLRPADGEPWDTDTIIMLGSIWEINNVLPVPMGDTVINWQADMKRQGRDPDAL